MCNFVLLKEYKIELNILRNTFMLYVENNFKCIKFPLGSF